MTARVQPQAVSGANGHTTIGRSVDIPGDIWLINLLLAGAFLALVLTASRLFVAPLLLLTTVLFVRVGLKSLSLALGAYFALAFHTATFVTVVGSAYGAAVKDVLLVTVFASRILFGHEFRDSSISRVPSANSLAVSAVIGFGILLAFQTLVILALHQSVTVWVYGMRSTFAYMAFAYLAYRLGEAEYSRLFRMILWAGCFPLGVAMVQFMQLRGVGLGLPHMVLDVTQTEQIYGGSLGFVEAGNLPRTPGTMTSATQFGCLTLVAGITWLIHVYNLGRMRLSGSARVPKGGRESLFFGVAIVLGTIACGNRAPLLMLAVLCVAGGFAFIAEPVRSGGRSLLNAVQLKFNATIILVVVGTGAVALFAAAVIFIPDLKGRYMIGFMWQLEERGRVLHEQVAPFFQLPAMQQLFGVGSATQSSAIRHVGDTGSGLMMLGAGHSESQLITQLIELGFAGMAIFFYGRLVVVLIAWRANGRLRSAGYPLSTLPFVVGFSVVTTFPYANFINYDPMNAFYWMLFGLLCRQAALAEHPSGNFPQSITRRTGPRPNRRFR